MTAPALVLFDIDGTILLTEGAGTASMLAAGRELFGDSFTFDGIDVAGRLDSLIWNDLCQRNRVEPSDDNHARFRSEYGRRLRQRLASQAQLAPLPGVVELIAALQGVDDLELGLLTGNYPETGRMKISSAGIDPDVFVVAAWGIDGRSRRELPPVAMRRHSERHGRPTRPERVVIIGDTPHDIDCAAANGCRVIAVATGKFPLEELLGHGPDVAVASLADTKSLVARVEAWARGVMRSGDPANDEATRAT